MTPITVDPLLAINWTFSFKYLTTEVQNCHLDVHSLNFQNVCDKVIKFHMKGLLVK